MRLPKTALIAAGIAGATALSGCTDGYGYSGVSVGYNDAPYYYDNSGYYNGAYGDPYGGWYGDYYYPGTGVYGYDTQRRRYRWNAPQRRYWEQRRQTWRGERHQMRENWRGFDRRGDRDQRRYRRGDRDDWRDGDRRRDRRDRWD